MSITLTALSMLAGWCGTVPVVLPPLPVVPKPPRPICLVCIAVAAFGGLGMAMLVSQAFPTETPVLSVAVAGFIGGRVVSDLFNGYVKN